jgi:hypothetical protein
MTEASELQSCEEVTHEVIEAAFNPVGRPHPAQRVLRLLERMARVAKPKTGAHRILLVLAKLAQVDWINGGLLITFSEFGEATEVDIRVDDGKIAARWRSLSVAVPLSEFSDFVRQWPGAIRPLTLFGEPVPERLQLRAHASASSRPAPMPAAGNATASRTDKHRKQTARREDFEVPEEAYRAHESVPPIPVDDDE